MPMASRLVDGRYKEQHVCWPEENDPGQPVQNGLRQADEEQNIRWWARRGYVFAEGAGRRLRNDECPGAKNDLQAKSNKAWSN